MILKFWFLRRWAPPVTSVEVEKDLVAQIKKFGIPTLAKKVAPFPKRMLYISLSIAVISGVIGWGLDTQRPLNGLGRVIQFCAAAFMVWGVLQAIICAFMGVLNYGGAVNWLTRIQKFHSDSDD